MKARKSSKWIKNEIAVIGPEPTDQLYQSLKEAKNFFARELFNNELPTCVLTVQRKNDCVAYYSARRWRDTKTGQVIDEIAMNPAFFATRGLLDVLSSMVHEQTHQWQEYYGTPSRRTYHNVEFSEKMETLGLITSTTGRPDGKRTGQKITHYVMRSGPFYAAARRFIESGYHLPLVDLLAKRANPLHLGGDSGEKEIIILDGETEDVPDVDVLPGERVKTGGDESLLLTPYADTDGAADSLHYESDEDEPKKSKPKSKVKFTCPVCAANAWGKPTLRIGCLTCDKSMESAELVADAEPETNPPAKDREFFGKRLRRPTTLEELADFINEFCEVAQAQGKSVMVQGEEHVSAIKKAVFRHGYVNVSYQQGAADIDDEGFNRMQISRSRMRGLDIDGEPIMIFTE